MNSILAARLYLMIKLAELIILAGILSLIVCVIKAYADPFAEIGYGGLSAAMDAAAGYQFSPLIGMEAEYIDECIQPNGIPNQNEIINLDSALSHKILGVDVSLKAGFSNEKQAAALPWSGFNGGNIGIEASYPIMKHISLFGEIVEMHSMQYIRQYENFTYGSLGMKFQ